MDTLELARLNQTSPMVLGFVLGIVAVLLKSDLKLPEALHAGRSVYLLLAIGIEGWRGSRQGATRDAVAQPTVAAR